MIAMIIGARVMIKMKQKLIKRTINELAAAIGVMALVFLSFTYSPVNAYGFENPSYLGNGDISVYCGQAPKNDGHYGLQCDSCRLSFSINLPNVADVLLKNSAFLALVELDRSSKFKIAQSTNRFSYARAPPFII